MPPITLNSTSDMSVMVPDGEHTLMNGYAILPDEVAIHITDGQHRFLAIKEVMDSLHGTLEGDEFARMGIPFMMTIESDLRQTHQDFADAAKSRPLPPSLLAVYNTRQPNSRALMEIGDRSRLFKGKLDATSSSVGKNSPYVFLMSQVRQFVKSSITGVPAPSERLYESVAGNILGAPETYQSWVDSRVAFMDAAADAIGPWRDIVLLPLPGGTDAADLVAKMKAIRSELLVPLSPTFLKVLGIPVVRDVQGSGDRRNTTGEAPGRPHRKDEAPGRGGLDQVGRNLAGRARCQREDSQ